MSPDEQSHITFYIQRRGGITARLHNFAIQQPGVPVPVLLDGPYGGIDTQKFYGSDRIVVIAGGSGAGWSLPFIEQYVRCWYSAPKTLSSNSSELDSDGNSGSDQEYPRVRSHANTPQSLRVILATRDTATRVWFHKAVSDLLSGYAQSQSANDLTVEVFLTGEAEQPREIGKGLTELNGLDPSPPLKEKFGVQQSSQSCISGKELPGRPQLPRIIHEEAVKVAETKQSLGIFACGPLTMQNDIRNAVATENLEVFKNPKSTGVYLHLEHFSWA